MEVQSPTPRTTRAIRFENPARRAPVVVPVARTTGALALPLAGAGLGLLAGLAGLVSTLAQSRWTRTVRPDFLRLNRHAFWMMPVADALLLCAVGSVLALGVRLVPRIGVRRAFGALAFVASLEVVATVGGLHFTATWFLAAGMTACAVRLVRARDVALGSLAKRLTTVGLILLAAAIGVGAWRLGAGDRASAALASAHPNTPNVLLVVLDTVRADRVSLHGYPRPTTPNLDRLARQGFRFDQARAPAPYTMPSHASMFTGRWPHELNDVQYSPLDGKHPTLAEHLHGRGYRTGGFVGNTYYCNEWFGLARGFTHYEDFPQRRKPSPFELLRAVPLGRAIITAGAWFGLLDDQSYERRVTAAEVNRRALDWLDRGDGRAAGSPFFLFVNYIDAHAPYFPPGDYTRRFSELGKTIHGYNLLNQTQRKKLSENTPEDHQNRLDAAVLLGDAYDDCLGYLDEQLGRLLGELDRRGVLDNTLVVVTSDHGEHLGEHELFGHGTSLYQALVHVPLVVVPPQGRRPGQGVVVDRAVSPRAIPATVVDVLGPQGTRSPFPGRSLIAGDGAEDLALSELDLQDHSRSTRPGQWHSPAAFGPMQALVRDGLAYIHNGNDREELYDVAHDPTDRHDLAGRPEFVPALERFRRDLKGVLTPR